MYDFKGRKWEIGRDDTVDVFGPLCGGVEPETHKVPLFTASSSGARV